MSLIYFAYALTSAGRHAASQAPALQSSSAVPSFFLGCSRGQGDLRVITKRRRTIVVDSFGRRGVDGALLVEQIVRQADRPPARRQWRLQEVAPGQFAGTLSTASSPVSGVLSGNVLRLSFRMENGLGADQYLSLADDGRSIDNRMTVRKWGMVVATLRETITKCAG